MVNLMKMVKLVKLLKVVKLVKKSVRWIGMSYTMEFSHEDRKLFGLPFFLKLVRDRPIKRTGSHNSQLRENSNFLVKCIFKFSVFMKKL